MRNQRGVTLIEMMVVVTVIALFSGIAGVRYFGQVERGRTVAAKSQLNAFTAGLAAFQADVGRFPTEQEGLAALRKAPMDAAKTCRGPYIVNEIPHDPWGRPHIYEGTSSAGEPWVICLGAEGAPGGDGASAHVFSWKCV
jgi:general secretion pathway protein G